MAGLGPDFIFVWSSKYFVEAIAKLALSVVCSVIISIEREFHTHPGGMATHSLVGLGSCLFTMISLYMRERYAAPNADPARICAQIVNGMGFLGSATVFKSNNYVKGINTAANLWICAAISMAIGAGLWEMAVLTSLFTAGVLSLNNWYKQRLYRAMQEDFQQSQADLENPSQDTKSPRNIKTSPPSQSIYSSSKYIDLENLTGHKDSLAMLARNDDHDESKSGFMEMARLTKLVSNLVMSQELARSDSQSAFDSSNTQLEVHDKTV
jgi:uncharacterized membrane protein YhiD involved in acid resistance